MYEIWMRTGTPRRIYSDYYMTSEDPDDMYEAGYSQLNSYNMIHDIKLSMATNSAGTLTFKCQGDFAFNFGVPITNLVNNFGSMGAEQFWVKRGSEWIWDGCLTNVDYDMYNVQTAECEGALSYLSDTIQPPKKLKYNKPIYILKDLLATHNANVGGACDKTFTLGTVTVSDTVSSEDVTITNYETTYNCIKNLLLDVYGGYLRVRYGTSSDGTPIRYLDYLSENYTNSSAQTIQFGKNLLDFTSSLDFTGIVTVLVPRGMKVDDAIADSGKTVVYPDDWVDDGLEEYVTIAAVNSGSIYYKDTGLINTYGIYREQVVDFENVSNPKRLLEKAKKYLSKAQFEKWTYEVSAVDLSAVSGSYKAFNLFDRVQFFVGSSSSNYIYLPITKLDIEIDHPEETKITLSGDDSGSLSSFNSSTSAYNQSLLNDINQNGVKLKSLVDLYRDNAAAQIELHSKGYFTITTDDYGTNEVYFTPYRCDGTNFSYGWVWNMGGLGYKGSDGKWKVALTADGTISGDRIAVGTVYAEAIDIGYTTKQDKKWQDELGNNYWTSVVTQSHIESTCELFRSRLTQWVGDEFDDYDTAMNGKFTEIKQTIDSISTTVEKKVDGNKFGTYIEQYYDNVRIAWNKYGKSGSYKYISFELQDDYPAINSYNSSGNKIVSFNKDGIYHYYNGTEIGRIGTSCDSHTTSARGLSFNLDYNGSYMSWSVKKSSSASAYSHILVYINKAFNSTSETYSANTLHAYANLNMHNYTITSGKFYGAHYDRAYRSGTTLVNNSGNLRMVCIPTGIRSDGTVSSYVDAIYVSNGLIVNPD